MKDTYDKNIEKNLSKEASFCPCCLIYLIRFGGETYPSERLILLNIDGLLISLSYASIFDCRNN